MNKNIVKLAIDLAKGQVQEYSADRSTEVLRNAFKDLAEYTEGMSAKEYRRSFERNKVEIYAILEEIINETVHEGLKNQLQGFAEYRNLSWGDENLFKVPANNIFRVALISDGNGNLRRQRLVDGQEFSVGLDTYGIKVGEDFHRFLAGRVDWVEFTTGIAESFSRDLTQRIFDAVMKSYGEFGTVYHHTYTTSPTEDDLLEMAMHIQARTGEKVSIYGTKLALRKLAPSAVTDSMTDAKNKVGYYGEIAGITLHEIEQSHAYGTDTFAIDNNFALLLPQNADKMIKVVNEGDAIIQEQQDGLTADMMKEHTVIKRFGINIITSKVFGFIKFP